MGKLVAKTLQAAAVSFVLLLYCPVSAAANTSGQPARTQKAEDQYLTIMKVSTDGSIEAKLNHNLFVLQLQQLPVNTKVFSRGKKVKVSHACPAQAGEIFDNCQLLLQGYQAKVLGTCLASKTRRYHRPKPQPSIGKSLSK